MAANRVNKRVSNNNNEKLIIKKLSNYKKLSFYKIAVCRSQTNFDLAGILHTYLASSTNQNPDHF
jgi:hypothetical protein